MDVKQFENRRWRGGDQVIEWRHRAALNMINNGTVLDLGSGDGLFLSLLKHRGIAGVGLDLSEEGVAKAKAKGLDTRVFDFASNSLPFADNSFDTVVMLDILEHLYDPTSLLKEATRVSRRDVIVGVPNFNSLPARLQMFFGYVPENNQPKKGHVYWFNYSVFNRMSRDVGLSIKDFRANTNFEKVHLVRWIFIVGLKLLPNLFSLSFVVKTSK